MSDSNIENGSNYTEVTGDFYEVVIQALKYWITPQNWNSKVDHDMVLDDVVPEKVRLQTETLLKEILTKHKTISVEKLVITGAGKEVHYALKLKTKEIEKKWLGEFDNFTFYLLFIEWPEMTAFYGGIQRTLQIDKALFLRALKGRPLQLKELYESTFPVGLDTSVDLWQDFDDPDYKYEQISRDQRKTISIYEMTQECLNCHTTQPISLRACVQCGQELPICHICKRGFSTKDQITPCPHCSNMFHRSHIYAYVQSKGQCAVCKRKLTLTQL